MPLRGRKSRTGLNTIFWCCGCELFGLVVTPPLDKRRQEWMNEIGSKLKELEENTKVNFENLSQNEQFH
jgi:hypothetical protein